MRFFGSVKILHVAAQAKAGRVALLLAHENITNGFYPGNDKQLLVANVLFKLGGSAAVMSTRPQDRRRAKYELMCTERTIRTSAADLDCIQCAPPKPHAPITWGYYYLTRTACLYSNQALKAAWESRTSTASGARTVTVQANCHGA